MDTEPVLNKVPPQVSGFSLLELVIVLAVLTLTASVAAFSLRSPRVYTSDRPVSAEEIVTSASLVTLRDALLGTSQSPGLWPDLGGQPHFFPRSLASLFQAPTNLPGQLVSYSPRTRLGWRGPYLAGGGSLYSVDSTRGFTTDYGAPGDPVALDGWGHPIVLQVPAVAGVSEADAVRNARLVSAGPDGILQTPRTRLTPSDIPLPLRGDDLVLFLQVKDVP